MTDNPASILEDERIYSGFLAPSYMPEGGYDVIAGVSGWPRPVRGYIGAGGVGGPPDGQSSVDYPGEYVPDFPDYEYPAEDPVPKPVARPTGGLEISYYPYSYSVEGDQTARFFGPDWSGESLGEYVSGWEKPGWTANDFYDLGVFNAQEFLHYNDRDGLYVDKIYSVPNTGYAYDRQLGLLEQADTLPIGSEERQQLIDQYQEYEEAYKEQRLAEYETLTKLGTPFQFYNDIYSRGQETPYGIATSDSLASSPSGRSGSFANYNDERSFFTDILDKTSPYYSSEADDVWNLGYFYDWASDDPYAYDYSRQYFSLDPRFAGIETDNTAYWLTPTPDQISLLSPSGFSWADTDPAEFVSSLPGGLLSDPIYGIVGGGIVDAGPVTETPYG